MDGACGTCGRQERCVQGFIGGKPEGKRPFVRPRCRWEDNFKMDPQEVRWGDTDWIDLVLDTDQ